MKRMSALIGLAVLASIALTPAARAQAPASVTNPPPVAYHVRTLPNGLKVFTVLDRTTPNVTVQVWYGVGSKNDPAGRSGFAHLFEHLMFKGARDMPPEYMDRLTEDVGGLNNASTNDDYTEYHEVIPANHLQRLLWAEAERMSGLVVDQANFTSERAVVEEELRQRVLADPYGRLFALDLPEASFAVHPYHRPPIGSIADLDASTLDDVRAFHAVYYRPDNASLIVVGNFEPARLDAWVDQYFAPIAKPETPLPQITAVEPPRTAAKTIDAYGPNVPLPAVVISFPAPDAASPDAAPLQVLDALLSTGKSSRLYQSLVYRQQLASTAFSEADLRAQGGLFAVGAILASGKTPDQGEAALRAEVARMQGETVSAAELTTAKNQLIANVLRGRETVEGLGTELGQAITVEGDPARINSDIKALGAVSAADVQRVARQYLAGERGVTIRYRAEYERPPGEKDVLSQDSPLVSAAPLPTQASVAVFETLPADKRQAPPPPSAPIPALSPKPVQRTLPNGLRVIVAKTSDLPIVTADLVIASGSALDPPHLGGLASLTAQLLPEGTSTRSATAVAAETEALGGSIGAAAGHDSSSVSFSGLAATLPRALPILADVVRHPAFAQEELDRLRQQSLDALSLQMQDPGALAGLVMAPVVFGAGPYGHPSSGSPRSLKRITRVDVARQYARLYRPDNAVLVLTGDIEPEAGFSLARRAFGDWRRPAGAAPAAAPTTPVATGRVVIVDLPGTGQAAVAVGARSIARRSPAYFTVEVAASILGGGYSARLNEEVRVKRGLSYGASSRVEERRDSGLFEAVAQTRNEAADEVAGLILEQIKDLGAKPAAREELDAREAALTGQFGRTAATSAGLAGLLAEDAVYHIDLGDLARYAANIDAVTADQALAAAGQAADPAKADVVVVGDAKLFEGALKKRFGHVLVIPADKLDLEAPALR